MTPDVLHEVVAVGVTDLFGNASSAPTTARASRLPPRAPATRRFDLWRMLPKHNRRDDHTGDLFRFIACLQEVTDLLLADVDRWPDIFDLERAPEAFVDLILRDLGNPFPFELDAMGKRRLASVLVEMYRQKGTAKGIQNAIRFFLGIDISAITPFNADTLYLGESLLGVDWVLGPSDRFARYAFNVEVARILTDARAPAAPRHRRVPQARAHALRGPRRATAAGAAEPLGAGPQRPRRDDGPTLTSSRLRVAWYRPRGTHR
jgi:phage tail-like protein